MLLSNEYVNSEIKEKDKKLSGSSENEHTTTQNQWNTVKAVLRGKFIAIEAHLQKRENFQINNLTLHLQELEKQQQRQP